MIQTLLSASTVVVLLFCSADLQGKVTRPNIVFILIDDMGWPDLGCYGHAFHETPRIDQLAQQGVRFTDFYATPVCSSTRATIESGQNSARVGITDFLPGHWKPFAKLVVPAMPDHLDHQLTTPGEVLGRSGYNTAYFGKWHLGRGPEHGPSAHGYETTAGNLGAEFEQSRKGRKGGPKGMVRLTDQANWFLAKQVQSKRPFFLHLSHKAVHIPIQAKKETVAKYEKKEKPNEGVNHPVYAAMIEDLDVQIGRLLDELDRLQLTDNTVVILTSDNGGLRQVYTGRGQVVSTNAPLRSEKGTLYEGGIRVPMIVRWPGVTPPGTVCNQLAATWDMLPTFCAIASVDPPGQTIDGHELTGLFRQQNSSPDRRALYFHYPHYHHSRPASAIRSGDYKLIEWLEDDSVELYDLASDIGETNNLASTEPEKASQLRDQLSAWRTEVGARMPTKNPDYNEEKADVWYNRNSKQPLDSASIDHQLESQATKPYLRKN